MTFTAEILASGVVGFVVIIGAIGRYLQTRNGGSNAPATHAGLAGTSSQFDELIAQVRRIADALTDKNTAGINEKLEALADRLDRSKPPVRRR